MPEVSAQGRRGQDGGSSRNHLQGNVPDIRNSKVIDIVMELRSFGADVHVAVADPRANPGECEQAYGITPTPLADLPAADAVILAVGHHEYAKGAWSLVTSCLKPSGGLVMDVKSLLDRAGAPQNVPLWRM